MPNTADYKHGDLVRTANYGLRRVIGTSVRFPDKLILEGTEANDFGTVCLGPVALTPIHPTVTVTVELTEDELAAVAMDATPNRNPYDAAVSKLVIEARKVAQ